jgi:hypothetical protein
MFVREFSDRFIGFWSIFLARRGVSGQGRAHLLHVPSSSLSGNLWLSRRGQRSPFCDGLYFKTASGWQRQGQLHFVYTFHFIQVLADKVQEFLSKFGAKFGRNELLHNRGLAATSIVQLLKREALPVGGAT